MKYAIYGTNRVAKDFIYIFDKLDVVCFFDDADKDIFCEKKVNNIKHLQGYSNLFDILVVCDFDKSSKISKLKQYGMEYKKDYVYEEDFFGMLDTWKIPAGRKVAIWGMGRIGNQFVSRHPELSINLFIDTNKNNCDGIISPEEIENWKDYFVIITVVRNHEIVDYLCEKELKETEDFAIYSEYEALPSELLRKTIFDEACYSFECNTMQNHLEILSEGSTACCCTTFVSHRLGSIVEKNVDQVWKSIVHKILCLSTENKTYSFCDKKMCPFFIGKKSHGDLNLDIAYKKMKSTPSVIVLGYDKICNLKCITCRKDYISESQKERSIKEIIVNKVENDLLNNCKFLVAAGDGEVFLSNYYKRIYTSDKAKNIPYIRFLSNGMLFNQKKWEEIKKNKIGKIMLTVSIDAATKETYKKIRRGGDFDILKENMKYASELRKNGELSYFRINFVVQKENYKEMVPFVKWGIDLGCDEIFFTKILNWGTYSKEEFKEISMMEEDGITPKRELQEILEDPIMKDSKVDLGTIQYSHESVQDEVIENYYMWELERRKTELFER